MRGLGMLAPWTAALGSPKNEWFISEFVRNELLMTNANGSSVSGRIAISTAWRANWLLRRVMGTSVLRDATRAMLGDRSGDLT